MVAGVYKITIKSTGDTYIGSSYNVTKRWATYIGATKPGSRNGGISKTLANALRQQKADNLSFEIIEITDHIRERESYWIQSLNPSLNRCIPAVIPIDEPGLSEWEKEMHEVSKWWQMLDLHGKLMVQWRELERLRLHWLNWELEQGRSPSNKLITPLPMPVAPIAKYGEATPHGFRQRKRENLAQ